MCVGTAQGHLGMRRSLAEDATGCVPEASVQRSSPRDVSSGASKAYSFVVGLSRCFRGKVRMCTSVHHLNKPTVNKAV